MGGGTSNLCVAWKTDDKRINDAAADDDDDDDDDDASLVKSSTEFCGTDLKDALDPQAGFRKNRSCADHILTMRVILEQSLE